MRALIALALASSVLLAACGEDVPVRAAAASASADGAPDPLELKPTPTSYRGELRRAAMRGISYESGRARLVPEDAAQVVPTPDPAVAPAAAERARELVARNETIEALAEQTRAVLNAPEDPAQYLALGDVLMANRHGVEALAAYRSGLELDPRSAALHAGAGRALVWVGKRSEAVDELRAARELDPSDVDALRLLAIQLYYLDDPGAAWEVVHDLEARGGAVPPQFRALLEGRMQEPKR